MPWVQEVAIPQIITNKIIVISEEDIAKKVIKIDRQQVRTASPTRAGSVNENYQQRGQ